jgi:hypothetical protein
MAERWWFFLGVLFLCLCSTALPQTGEAPFRSHPELSLPSDIVSV